MTDYEAFIEQRSKQSIHTDSIQVSARVLFWMKAAF